MGIILQFIYIYIHFEENKTLKNKKYSFIENILYLEVIMVYHNFRQNLIKFMEYHNARNSLS